ncbi:MAG: PAS domain S-box protein [Verrucomicrobia bacterium]|nr:PAS domain S-box protein [Verrucomicrobiota bacterium]
MNHWIVLAALVLLGCGAARGADKDLLDLSLRPGLLTSEERMWLTNHPVIRVAPSPNFQPVEFLDTSGRYWGIASEYMRIASRRLGCRLVIVALSNDAWGRPDPDGRGADVHPAAGGRPEDDRFWSHTQPYLTLPTYLFMRRGADPNTTLALLDGRRVAVVEGTFTESFVRAHFPRVVVGAVSEVRLALREVSSGAADACVLTLPVATEWVEREGILNLKLIGEAGFVNPVRMAVRKDWPELSRILEKALATITPTERAAIYRRWVRIEAPSSNEGWKRWALWVAGGLLIGLILVMAWNRSLATRVEERTAEVRAELSRRIEADKALESAEERFSKAFQSSPVAMCIVSLGPGRLVDVNAAFLRGHGFKSRAEAVGETLLNLGLWAPLDLEALFGSHLETARRVVNSRLPFSRRSGQRGVGLFSVEAIDLGGEPCAIVLVNDITERERAEEALRLSEEKFARAFRNSPDAIVLTAMPAGRIVEVNDGMCRLSGFTREELLCRTTEELDLWSTPGLRERYLRLLHERGRVEEFEAECRRKDGSLRQCLVSGELLALRYGPHIIATVRDITERKRAEDERRRLLTQLLESEDEERRRIARELHDTTAQHLAAIQMNLSRLRQDAPTGTGARLIADSYALAEQSVREIRTLTYLLHPPLLDELGLAGALTDYATGFSKRSGIRVDVDAEGYRERLPRGQELALFRVAQESLTNLRHHSGSATASIRLESDAEEVRLEVQDSGRGLPLDAAEGVGLRGMKERLRQIGGELEIESDAEGTTVLASVPVRSS